MRRRPTRLWLAAAVFLFLVAAPSCTAKKQQQKDQKRQTDEDALAAQYSAMAAAAGTTKGNLPDVGIPMVATLWEGQDVHAVQEEEDVAEQQQASGNVKKGSGKPEKPPGRPLPPNNAPEEENEAEEEEAEEERYERAHPPPAKGKGPKPWWTEGEEEMEGGAVPGGGPQPWQQACEGEWGYEGYANKTGRGGGKGNGPKGGFDDEAEYEKRCARFQESVQYLSEFEAANPNATFTVGLNNMSDWTPQEQAALFGTQAPDFDSALVLDMDDTALVEALITGQATYEEVFVEGSGAVVEPTATTVVDEVLDAEAAKEAAVNAASTLIGHDDAAPAGESAAESVVEFALAPPSIDADAADPDAAAAAEGPAATRRRERRILGRALPSTPASNMGSLVLPAVIDYRYMEFNPYKVVAVTPVKVRWTGVHVGLCTCEP